MNNGILMISHANDFLAFCYEFAHVLVELWVLVFLDAIYLM